MKNQDVRTTLEERRSLGRSERSPPDGKVDVVIKLQGTSATTTFRHMHTSEPRHAAAAPRFAPPPAQPLAHC